MAYDIIKDYAFNGTDEYPVYYVFRVRGYINGNPVGEKVGRFINEAQAERLCDYLNRKEVA